MTYFGQNNNVFNLLIYMYETNVITQFSLGKLRKPNGETAQFFLNGLPDSLLLKKQEFHFMKTT